MIVSLVYWKDNPFIPLLQNALDEEIVVCLSKEEALNALPQAEIVLTMGGSLDAAMLRNAGKLKLVLSLSAGVEHLPLEELRRRGVRICNPKGSHAVSIAEYVLGGMLSVSHQFPAFLRNQEQTVWKMSSTAEDLEGKTLCVIGAGSIGQEIGKKAKAFDMNVIGLKRHPEPLAFFDEVWGNDRIGEALGLADYVVLVTPMTPETYHLMGKEQFQMMKETAIFINVSRGDTVDEDALISALKDHRIGGAVLDVFHREPLPQDSPLWSMGQALVTPHNSGLTGNTVRKVIEITRENIRRYREGRDLINQIENGRY